MNEMIGIAEARRLVLGGAAVLPAETVSLARAFGRTLAAPVVSAGPIPAFASSAMDGFAVRTADLAALPVTLPVAEDVPAGAVPRRPVEAGTVVRIMTGAPVPEGADAVVPVEWTAEVGAGRVRIDRAPEAGRHVRPAGEDVRLGETVLGAGRVVTPPVVGMLAALGEAEVAVRCVPRVAVVTTGDELVPAHVAPAFGQLRDSNGPALAAQVRDAGGEPLGPLHAADTLDALRAVLAEAREADVLVVAGGVSMGDRDLVRVALDEAGWRPQFWRVRQRPGKPLAFGLLGGRPVLGLPGNPVSSFVGFEQYVRPLLAAMLGRAEVRRPLVPAVLEAPVRKAAGLHHFVRGLARWGEDGRLYVRPTGAQGSNLYTSAVRADGLIHLPEDVENPPEGAAVAFEFLSWS